MPKQADMKKYIKVPINRNEELVSVEILETETLFKDLENAKYYVCKKVEYDNDYDCDYILIHKTGNAAIISTFWIIEDKVVFGYDNENILYVAMPQDCINDKTVKETLAYTAREYCKCYDEEPCQDNFKICVTDKYPSEVTYDFIKENAEVF